MRLEDDEYAAVSKLAGGLDRRPDFGRMVRVVVVHGRALKDAEHLHAAVRARERFKRGGDLGERNADLECHGGRCGRVLDVVTARLLQVDPAELVSAEMDRE